MSSALFCKWVLDHWSCSRFCGNTLESFPAEEDKCINDAVWEKKLEITQLFCKTGWMDGHRSDGGRLG